ncbi:MAG: undecaprenyldiphospho-muramoylpentapeptide beta-N-acetylglucosaminyltransferase [Prevotellaceae bacterium]|jgi:UDP-N-acetylglucosamine--N-acetylmuramyl-(pentapeptide) pyrophosphoryl-undecaprenol N-acetylglucosamine transferase|nr:undecaprenyldiphospho-muramoylpentapeptide beta-N-acetylglucosaminyltransferase [Prevotellaceae bacterium]
MKFLISGGGTGGHIFPAISIANALRAVQPDCEILFIGANSRMEMERVPKAGYDIVGLDVQGLERMGVARNAPTRIVKNFAVIKNFIKSYFKAKKIVKDFAPDVAIGVGGYVSGAAMRAAAALKVPILLQEQNSFAGVTNKFLAKKAAKICVAYDGMEKFFPKEKIILTGNPVRELKIKNEELKIAYDYFGLNSDKKTLLVVGGSLGAKTINESIFNLIENVKCKMKNDLSDLQIIWQTGKNYYNKIAQKLEIEEQKQQNSAFYILHSTFYIAPFIDRMDFAYSIADLVISRAGASTISELCLLEKAAILVPSPNVAENHQYHNAMALVEKNAAILVLDNEAQKNLTTQAISTIFDNEKLDELRKNIAKLAVKNSAEKIAEEVMKLMINV